VTCFFYIDSRVKKSVLKERGFFSIFAFLKFYYNKGKS